MLAVALTSCRPPPPPGHPHANLAARFESRLAAGDPFPETEARAFVRVLGPAVVPILERQPLPADIWRRRFVARLLAAAAQGGLRSGKTLRLAEEMAADPDEETRRIARAAVVASLWDPGAASPASMHAMFREAARLDDFALPFVEEAIQTLGPEIRRTDTDPRLLPRGYDRLPPVKSVLDPTPCLLSPAGDSEKFLWLCLCALSGHRGAISSLQDLVEPEPRRPHGRPLTRDEGDAAFSVLRAAGARPFIR